MTEPDTIEHVVEQLQNVRTLWEHGPIDEEMYEQVLDHVLETSGMMNLISRSDIDSAKLWDDIIYAIERTK